jgi:predicted nucleic-acid-binding Zn-ribbon protein
LIQRRKISPITLSKEKTMMTQCPKCGSNEIISKLQIQGGDGHPPFVDIVEPDPANRPFIWMPKRVQSHFRIDVCGACGYAEFYAENYKALNEGYKQGFRSK